MSPAVIEAVLVLGLGITEAARAAGPLGAPAGKLYAVCMTAGIDLATFHGVLSVLEGAGLVKVTPGHAVIYTGPELEP